MKDITEQVALDPYYFAAGRYRLRVLELHDGQRQVWLTDDNNHIATLHGETFEQTLMIGEDIVDKLER